LPVLVGFKVSGSARVADSHDAYVGDRLNIRVIVNWYGVTDLELLDTYWAAGQEDPAKSGIG